MDTPTYFVDRAHDGEGCLIYTHDVEGMKRLYPKATVIMERPRKRKRK